MKQYPLGPKITGAKCTYTVSLFVLVRTCNRMERAFTLSTRAKLYFRRFFIVNNFS